MIRILAVVAGLMMGLMCVAQPKFTKENEARAAEIVAQMTLEEKVAQMVQPEQNGISLSDITKYGVGSVLSGGGSMGDPAALAGAIGEALMTTVAGLIVSIPSIIFYNYFVSRVRRRIAEMESNVTSVLIKLFGRV